MSRRTTRISAKNQITIPAIPVEALRAAGLSPGDRLPDRRPPAGALGGPAPGVEVIVADAGVIIATLDADDARHQESRAVLAAAWADRLSLVVPAVAYAESMVVTADERWAGLDVGVRVRVIGAD